MKHVVFLVLVLISFFLDWIFQYVGIKWLWVSPLIYMITIATSASLRKEIMLLIFFALLIDLFSGFPLGVVTLTCLATVGTFALLKTRIQIAPQSWFALVLSSMFLSAEFFGILYVIR